MFDLFSPESNSTTTNISSEYQNSFNQALSSSSVLDNVGATTLNFGGAGGDATKQILPIVAITAIGLGLVALLKGKG